jgi:3-hydroxyisobutyrate dehydrogenase
MRTAFIGLGEAGAIYAAAAAAHGDDVSGYDPAAPTTPEGVTRAATRS